MQRQFLSRANTRRSFFLSCFSFPRFVAWPLELGLGTHNPRFVAWPLDLGSGTRNPRFVAWPLELGLGTHNARFVAWLLELGLGTHKGLGTRLAALVAIVVAAAPPPMPPLVRVHPPAVVPRQALATMCHQNPCLMGRQPAWSQDRKQPGQRSVLAPRVPARGHATSGRMIPMLEAPPLPSLLYIYICFWFVTRGRDTICGPVDTSITRFACTVT